MQKLSATTVLPFKKKILDFGLVGLFLFSLTIGLVGTFLPISSPKDFHENRLLARAPVLDDFRNPSGLPKIANSYIADNFGLRERFLQAYFWFRLKLIRSDLGLPSLIGKNGWLFIREDVSDFRRQAPFDNQQLQRIHARLIAWCLYTHQRNAEFAFFLGPNKSTIYPEMMPTYLTTFDRTSRFDQLLAVGSGCQFPIIDLRPVLLDHKDQLLYYKWGTHWNDAAGQLVWNLIRSSVSPRLRWIATPPTVSYRAAIAGEDSMWPWYGLSDPASVMLPVIRFSTPPIEEARAEGVGPTGDERVKLLFFGDSFMQYIQDLTSGYAGSSSFLLIGKEHDLKMADTPQKDAWLIMGSPKEYRLELMNHFKPNLVLLEIVERSSTALLDLRPPPGFLSVAERTDAQWTNGIANDPAHPALLLSSEPGNGQLFPGDRIFLAKSGIRRALRVLQYDGLTTVSVDGPLSLDDGYPNLVRELDTEH
jgi:hypothetical protein